MQIKTNLGRTHAGIQEDVLIQVEKMFKERLAQLYWSELIIQETTRTLANTITNKDLKGRISDRVDSTEGYLKSVEEVFIILGDPPRTLTSHGLKGLIREFWRGINTAEDGMMRDINVISALVTANTFTTSNAGLLSCLALRLRLNGVEEVFKSIADGRIAETAVLILQRAAIIGCGADV